MTTTQNTSPVTASDRASGPPVHSHRRFLPPWVKENLDLGFSLGIHEGHLTSYEPNVAYIEATGEQVHYCHHCENLANASEITPK